MAGAVVILLAVIAAVWWRAGSSAEPAAGETEATETSTEAAATLEIEPDIQRAAGLADQAAEERQVAETIQTTGVVGPDETRVARLRPLAEGRVTRVPVRVGDRVAAGQTLLVYDSITGGELLSEYRAAVAALERATAEADVARGALERADNLVEIGAVAKGERDRRAAEHQRAIAEVNSARAGVHNLEQKLRRLGVSADDLARARKGEEVTAASTSTISAPFGGVVTEVHAAPGEVITPERELFVLADLSRVWVQGDVYQKDIAKIRIGQQALVTVDAYPGETFTGEVTYVSNVLDADTRTAKVRCEVPNRERRLRVQMFATLALPVSMARASLVIPARAVQDIDGVTTVFVRVDEEHFQTRAVRVGAGFGDSVEILEGLQPGERVVTDGALMLKSRLKLRVEAEEDER
jgi:cobalt-zinc-cadmium efflux system membrane fusion protein